MTPQELKNSILQLAIQGKLVEQRPEEGTGAELYREIQQEKQRLIEAGKIKKEKPLPEIAEEEKPFEIPESWVWVRLRDIATLYNGRAYKQEELLSRGKYPVLRVGNLFTNNNWYYSDLELEDEKYCSSGDLLYAWSASFGPCIWQGGKAIFHYHIWKVVFSQYVFREYLYYFLMADTSALKKSGHGLAMIHITKEATEGKTIPLPPLAEQKRIVAKIEELLPFVDRYEQAWSRLETFNKCFPEDMKKSILQLAIQGKLVEQRPEEGTAEELYQQIRVEKQRLIQIGELKKEKDLSEIKEEDKPFEIPERWVWVRLGAIITLYSGTDFKPEEYNNKGIGIPYITGASSLSMKGVLVNRWTNTPKVFAKRGDVLLVCKGSGYGKTVICDIEQAHIARQIMAIRVPFHLSAQYVRYYLMASIAEIKSNGQGVIPGIDRNSVQNMLFPLPPLAEQKRIVAKLEELLPLCEKLK